METDFDRAAEILEHVPEEKRIVHLFYHEDGRVCPEVALVLANHPKKIQEWESDENIDVGFDTEYIVGNEFGLNTDEIDRLSRFHSWDTLTLRLRQHDPELICKKRIRSVDEEKYDFEDSLPARQVNYLTLKP